MRWPKGWKRHMDYYRDLILDHYRNPRNFGHLDKPDVVVEDHNISCGDRIVMEINLEIRNPKSEIRIKNVRFNGEGCAISQASASMLTEKVIGMNREKIRDMKLEDILAMLGTTLTPSRVKCAMLPLEVLQRAIISVKS